MYINTLNPALKASPLLELEHTYYFAELLC